MLTKYDEFLCHQISSTFDHPVTSAREWTERSWCMAHDIKGELILAAGFGYHPNRNIMDAFVCLAVEGKTQYVVRACRELRPRIDEIEVGPFAWDIIEPMRKVRARLGENEHGLSYDITFNATMPPHEEHPPQFFRIRGRVVEDICRFFQVGKPTGWIKVDGQTHNIDPDSWRTYRDRSWGVRRGAVELMETGVQPGEIPVGLLYSAASWHFDDWGASYHTREDWDGTPDNFSGGIFYPLESGKDEVHLDSFEHNFTFRSDVPGLRQVNGGNIILNAADGSQKDVSIRPLGVLYIGTGGYSPANFRGYTHGLWMGPSWMDGFKLDITDPKIIQESTYLDELVCELRCNDEIGYGMTEAVVVGKYPKYGYEGF